MDTAYGRSGSSLCARTSNEGTRIKFSSEERNDSCRRGFRGRRRLHSLAAIVRDYCRRHRPKTVRELQYFRKVPSLSAAITEAGLARYHDGKRYKRYSHQSRIPREALDTATKRLRRANLGNARSFADLIARVRTAVRSVHGIGELYVYDTAFRLGGHLELLPNEVYLHAGTRQGARALGLDHRSGFLSPEHLPVLLQQLKPHEIEDVLCIYKDWLRSAANDA
jgi:hypothetical protein